MDSGQFAGTMLGYLAVVGVVLVVIFLVFREFVCWYWKINQNIELLTEIRDLLAAKPGVSKNIIPPSPLRPQDQASPVQASSISSPEKKCAAVLHNLGYQLTEEDRVEYGKSSKKWTITSVCAD